MSRGAFNDKGFVPPRPTASSLPDIPGLGGALAGLGGGLAMIVVATMLSVAIDNDIWRQPREIAQLVLGSAAQTGWGPVVLGTILHFITAALAGAAFSILSRRVLQLPSDYGVQVLAGLIYGLALWFVAYFVILPLTNPALLDTYAPSFVIQHLVYGVVTGLIYTQLRPAPYASGIGGPQAPILADR